MASLAALHPPDRTSCRAHRRAGVVCSPWWPAPGTILAHAMLRLVNQQWVGGSHAEETDEASVRDHDRAPPAARAGPRVPDAPHGARDPDREAPAGEEVGAPKDADDQGPRARRLQHARRERERHAGEE